MIGVTRRNQITRHIEALQKSLGRMDRTLRPKIHSTIDHLPEYDRNVIQKYNLQNSLQIDRLVALGLITQEVAYPPAVPNPLFQQFTDLFSRAQTVETEEEVAQLISDAQTVVYDAS